MLRALTFNEKWVIAAPSEKKAQIIMGYVIDHLFDNEIFYSQLEVDTSLERIKRERSKSRLTFRRGGEVMTLTLDSRNSRRSLEAAMGFGSPNIVLDESSLIDDPIYATVKRMLGGHKDNFLFEIGNPFYRNHFYRTTKDESYYQIFADYKTAIAEGRYSEEFIREMRKEAFFDVYYECKFPDETVIDDRGYRQLVTSDHLSLGVEEPKGIIRLGCDIGGGGDSNVYLARSDNYAWIVDKNRIKDTMVNVTNIQKLIDDEFVKDENVAIDDIGIGRGVTDRLRELNFAVHGVSVGGKAKDATYSNLKAELNWKAAQWIKNGGVLCGDNDWSQCTWIKYKVNSDKQIKIEPKDELKKRTGKSPDIWDALCLTFYEPPKVGIISF